MKNNVHFLFLVVALAAVGCSDSDLERSEPDQRTEVPVGELPDGDGAMPDVDAGDDDEVVTPDMGTTPDDQQECNAGAVRGCYDGPDGTEGVGTCAPGEQTCEDGIWSGCNGSVVPAIENPFDGLDNNCDDSIDETAPADPALTGGHWHSCYLTDSHETYCWGHNDYGQIGDGTTTERPAPTRVNTQVAFDQIEAGYMFNCGIAGNAVYCWGENANGQLGDGTTTDRTTPTKVATAMAFKQVTAGDEHACGLRMDGKVACWGANNNAQITDPNRGAVIAWPFEVNSGVNFTTVTAGQLHTCALDEEGKAWCWGYNGHKQIGVDSPEVFVTTPTLVSEELRFIQISAGYRHTCGVTFDRETWCWGRNPAGQLGDGTQEDRGLPVAVLGKLEMKQVFTGYFTTCGITTTDETFCWGQNHVGQVGDGTTEYRLQPTAVATDQTFIDLAVMVTSTCGRNKLGDLYCWGENDYGQFGVANPRGAESPLAVTTLP